MYLTDTLEYVNYYYVETALEDGHICLLGLPMTFYVASERMK